MKNLIKIVVLNLLFISAISFISKPKEINIKKDIAPHVVPFKISILNNSRMATGFHLKYKGKVYIMTNKHVCDSHKVIYGHNDIRFGNYVGKIIKIDNLHDLCLVTSNRKDGLELSTKKAEDLDEVILVGYPRGIGKVIRKGYVIEPMDILAPWLGPGKIVETLRVSTIAYGGNSGSPVTNNKGKVIGVLFAGNGYHTEAFIVPLLYIEIFLAQYAL